MAVALAARLLSVPPLRTVEHAAGLDTLLEGLRRDHGPALLGDGAPD